MCVCVSEREKERERVCVCEREKERECVCVKEREVCDSAGLTCDVFHHLLMELLQELVF